MVVAGFRGLTAGLVIALTVLLAACGTGPRARTVPEPVGVLEEVPSGDWPVLTDDMDSPSLAEACAYSIT
jgi:hypothetical protein